MLSQPFSILARSSGAAPSCHSSGCPDPLQVSRPLSWWQRDGDLKPSDVDLIAACLDAARATVATDIPDTGDLPVCYAALDDHIRSVGGSDGELATLDLLASALLVAIDGARDRFADCVPLTIIDLCTPLAEASHGPLPELSMVTMADSLLEDARWIAAFKSGHTAGREVRR